MKQIVKVLFLLIVVAFLQVVEIAEIPQQTVMPIIVQNRILFTIGKQYLS